MKSYTIRKLYNALLNYEQYLSQKEIHQQFVHDFYHILIIQVILLNLILKNGQFLMIGLKMIILTLNLNLWLNLVRNFMNIFINF